MDELLNFYQSLDIITNDDIPNNFNFDNDEIVEHIIDKHINIDSFYSPNIKLIQYIVLGNINYNTLTKAIDKYLDICENPSIDILIIIYTDSIFKLKIEYFNEIWKKFINKGVETSKLIDKYFIDINSCMYKGILDPFISYKDEKIFSDFIDIMILNNLHDTNGNNIFHLINKINVIFEYDKLRYDYINNIINDKIYQFLV